MRIEGFARPAPLPGTSVPISTVNIDPHFANAPPGYQSVSEVITAFQNGDLTAEAAVDILIYQFNMSRPDATNMVFSASSTGQDLDEWVDEVEEGFKENLTDPDYSGPIPTPPTYDNDTIIEPPSNGAPIIQPPKRKLTEDQKYALIGLVVIGLLAAYYKRG